MALQRSNSNFYVQFISNKTTINLPHAWHWLTVKLSHCQRHFDCSPWLVQCGQYAMSKWSYSNYQIYSLASTKCFSCTLSQQYQWTNAFCGHNLSKIHSLKYLIIPQLFANTTADIVICWLYYQLTFLLVYHSLNNVPPFLCLHQFQFGLVW